MLHTRNRNFRSGSIPEKEKEKFGLEGSVYPYGTLNQSDRFIKTTKAIAEYLSKEMWTLVSKKEETEFEEPNDPGKSALKGQLKKYKMELKLVMEEKKTYKKENAPSNTCKLGIWM